MNRVFSQVPVLIQCQQFGLMSLHYGTFALQVCVCVCVCVYVCVKNEILDLCNFVALMNELIKCDNDKLNVYD